MALPGHGRVWSRQSAATCTAVQNGTRTTIHIPSVGASCSKLFTAVHVALEFRYSVISVGNIPVQRTPGRFGLGSVGLGSVGLGSVGLGTSSILYLGLCSVLKVIKSTLIYYIKVLFITVLNM